MVAPAQTTAPIAIFSWSGELEKGRQGVLELMDFLRAQGHRVVDLGDIMDAQRRDIDLLVDGEFVEVKSDFHKPVNAFLELTCDGKPGCVFKSRADYWLYYYPKYKRCFKFHTSRLQWFFALHQQEYRRVDNRSRNDWGKSWDANGVVVPLADLIEAGVAEEVPLGDE